MTDEVQKIREEVERLMNDLIQEKEKGFGSDIDDACILELQNVLTYIDSLQEEPVIVDVPPYAYVKGFSDGRFYEKRQKEEPVSDDLEETSKKYSSCIYLEEVLSDDDQEVLKARLMNTFKAGAEWQKEQLMKNSIELPLYLDGDFLTVDYDFTESGYKVGDKVKLIIIKEE